jgi:hypothetical protein
MYEAIARGCTFDCEGLPDEFGAGYRAIFGDRLFTPSYPHFRRLVNIGSNETLTDPANLDKLPNSVVALYQLSFIEAVQLQTLIDAGAITKHTSIAQATALRTQDERDYLRRREESKWRIALPSLEEKCRQRVRNEIVQHLMETLPEELQPVIEKRVAQMVEREKQRYEESLNEQYGPNYRLIGSHQERKPSTTKSTVTREPVTREERNKRLLDLICGPLDELF